jgi:hypothetical protein
VFVVEADGSARQRPVTVQRMVDSLAVLVDSLEPGTMVVIDGQLRLTPAPRSTCGPRRALRLGGIPAMNISGLFIRRPVATTLVMVAILLFGVMGYRLLPVSDLPNVDFPRSPSPPGYPVPIRRRWRPPSPRHSRSSSRRSPGSTR